MMWQREGEITLDDHMHTYQSIKRMTFVIEGLKALNP